MRRISIPLVVIGILLCTVMFPSPGKSCNRSEGTLLDHVKGLFWFPGGTGEGYPYCTYGDWHLYALSLTVEPHETNDDLYWLTLYRLDVLPNFPPYPYSVTAVMRDCFSKSRTTDWPWDDGEYGPYPDYPIIDVAANLGNPPGSGEDRCATTVGNPINVGTGNKFQGEVDFSVNTPGPELAFRRFYNSQSTYDGPLGHGWTHNYNLFIEDKGTRAIVWDADGKALRFRKEVDGSFTAAPLVYDRLVQDGGDTGDYVLFRKDNTIYRFDPGGRLRSIEDLNGNQITLTYEGDLLKKVTNNFGKEITFTYHEEDNRIETASDPKRNTCAFTYAGDNLTAVASPDGYLTEYLYEDPLDPHNMTEKRIAGKTVGIWSYDEHDRATYSSKAEGVEAVSLTYYGPPGSPDAFKVTITDSRGNERTYHLWALYGIPRVIHIGGVGCSACPGSRKDYDYHPLSFALIQITDRNDNKTDFSWDDRGNILTKTEASGTDVERTTTYTYTYDENNPLLVREKVEIRESVVLSPGGTRITTWRYDEAGNLKVKKEEGYVLVDGGPTLRTYTAEYGYTELGQLRWIDGPRTDVSDVTYFQYYENSESAGDNRGQLKAIINALDHRTKFWRYDASGNVGRITDLNGVVTAYTYDERNRVRFITNQAMGATTEYTYDSHGNLDYLVLPEGNTFDYTHDPAARLTEIMDALGNRISYTPDTEGNRIREEIFDTEDGLVKTVSMEYNDHNRMEWVKHPDGFVRHYEYDGNGNIYSITDENGHLTEYRYDGLDRLRKVIQHTDEKNIVAEYTYDSHDNLTSITDGNKNTTTYVYDDFSRVQEIISPDTGTTRYVHDEAGNLTEKSDAKGTLVTYTYDALNRLTKVHFPDSSQDLNYSYDSPSVSHGIGRLSGMTDPSGTSAFHYNPLGDITREKKTIKGVAYTTKYHYDREGQLKGLTYPSGRSVDYRFDDARRVKRVTTTRNDVKKTVAKDISYLPFGPLKDLTYGNGIALSQGFDLRYQLETSQPWGILNLDYERDGVGNIEAITDHLDPMRDQSFQYDDLDRVENARGIYGTIGYTYDDVGNRLTMTAGEETDTYVYIPDTNRLSVITGANPKSFEYDANGNTKSMGAMQFRYDQNDRLIEAIVEKDVVGRYTHNGRGQRTVKKTENGMTIYHYDLWGHLIAETKKGGKTLCEYLYLDDRLLAMAPTGGSLLLYAHPDHLGTPLKMTDKKGIVVWQADYRPFGEAVVDEDPDGDGKKVIMNLRFPGQYFDKETGLHYNYHRYYHPDIGRYLRPDPFGIDMFASNLFVYVNGNPIGKIDPFGLLIIDGLDCTEIARRIIPGLISGTPFDSYYYGRAVICVDIVIEDPLTCVCVGVLNDVYIDLYRNFVSYEVVYRCYPKGECGIDDFKIVTRIESEEGAPIERRRYVPRPELGKVTKLGTPIRYPSRNCSACPNGVGKPM